MIVLLYVIVDIGMDVLIYVIEVYVFVMVNDYIDGLVLKVIDFVFKYLLRVYKDGNDEEVREKMYNVFVIVGMVFVNVFFGINYSLVYKIGLEFYILYGCVNVILMLYVVCYNVIKLRKYVLFLKYEYFVVDERYVYIVRMFGFLVSLVVEGVELFVKVIIEFGKSLNINMSIVG